MQTNTPALAPQAENTALPVEVVNETPDLETMERGDSLAIWNGYKAELETLKASVDSVLASDPALPATAKIARANRLELRKIRIAVEKKRKELGDGHLRKIQGINSEANKLKELIEPYEDQLQAIEDHSERMEAERVAALVKSRTEEYLPFSPAGMPLPDFAVYTEEQFSALLDGAKVVHEAKLEQARKIEAERIAREKAEAEERERISLENERLKKEAEEREAAIAVERRKEADARAAEAARVEAEKKAAEEKARKEREAIEANAKAAREEAEKKAAAERAEFEAKAEAERKEAARLAQIEADRLKAVADKERKEREAAEAEIARQKKAEEDRIAAEERARQEAALAPDREKLAVFAAAVRALPVPSITSKRGQEIIGQKIEELAAWVESASKNLRAK
jgi:hypothetical protein